MRKRIVSAIIIVALILSIVSLPTYGATNSSDYILRTLAALSQGSNSGQIKISYSVAGTTTMSTIGVSKIEVYNSNGTKYKTISGSFANGLLGQNTLLVNGTYTISCVSGTTYYCKVTLYAGNSSGSDSRTITTGTVTAP